jgi:beta-xylosidase
MCKISVVLLSALILFLNLGSSMLINAQETDKNAQNPIIWADVPDPSVIRMGDVYYMSSTTMHVNPGVPIMKSVDLVNWEIVNYAYDILADNDALALRNGQEAYGDGSWASSIRYHDGTFYVVTFSYSTGKTHIYQTDEIENGRWSSYTLSTVCHDPSLLFDNDRVYLIYGINDIKIIELTSDVTAIKPGGLNQVLIPDASQIAGSNFYVQAEGSHIHKIDGKYYVFMITWPAGSMRTELVFRADSLTGSYEGRIALKDEGIAQGGLVDTPSGDWYALLFQDHGSVGRIPYLVPVTWEEGWPVFGVNGQVPGQLDIPAENDAMPKIVASDEFDWSPGDDITDGFDLPLVWQWNHNPDNDHWSVTERPGFLRLTNARIDSGFLDTQNTLTQRTFGPECLGKVAMDISHMKDGDVAGFGALQKKYGFVAVKMSGTSKSVVMVNGSSDEAVEVESIFVNQDSIYLQTAFDFQNKRDKAYFYYSLDGAEWNTIGNTLQMSYTLPHFMGYRFALFNYATKTTGGYVDFDWFRISIGTPTGVIPDKDLHLNKVPCDCFLGQNYPNPFNQSTRIEFSIPGKSYLSLKVYNLRGEEMFELARREFSIGVHSITFNSSRLASGIYFYKMQTKDFAEIKKMIILR